MHMIAMYLIMLKEAKANRSKVKYQHLHKLMWKTGNSIECVLQGRYFIEIEILN